MSTTAHAVKLKDQGNVLFKQGRFADALDKYSQDPTNGVYYSNRAMTNIKLEKWEDADVDCTHALKFLPDNAKVLWRRAIARRNLGKVAEARKDLEAASNLDPSNATIEDEFARLVWAEKKAAKEPIPVTEPPAASIPKVEKAISALSLDNKASSKSVSPTPKPPSKPPRGPLEPPKSYIRTNNTISKTAKTDKPILIQEVPSSSLPQPHDHSTTNRVLTKNPNRSSSDVPPRTDSSLQPLPHQPYSTIPISPTSKITFSTLEMLVRQNGISSDTVQKTLFNLDAGNLPEIFGQSGFDANFLETFLEAILSQRNGLQGQRWVSQSIALLDAIRKCGRFNIALTFAPLDKIRRVFEELDGQAGSDKRLQKVKSFWI